MDLRHTPPQYLNGLGSPTPLQALSTRLHLKYLDVLHNRKSHKGQDFPTCVFQVLPVCSKL